MAREAPGQGLTARVATAPSADAAAMVARLGLAPHPEGGWYRETWRAAGDGDRRGHASAILFLLDAGRASRWHRVDADELWLWHAGAPLALDVARADDAAPDTIRLGGDVAAGQRPQGLVPAGHWQAARAGLGWVLVSCVVAPGFTFEGFAMAAPGWMPGGGPARA